MLSPISEVFKSEHQAQHCEKYPPVKPRALRTRAYTGCLIYEYELSVRFCCTICLWSRKSLKSDAAVVCTHGRLLVAKTNAISMHRRPGAPPDQHDVWHTAISARWQVGPGFGDNSTDVGRRGVKALVQALIVSTYYWRDIVRLIFLSS